MVFACGLSSYNVGVFHLANHAFFKALLFLSAGSVIHAMADEQDMRRMGGLVRLLPFTYAMMFIGSLSLMGFPFLTGFYSKDVILELAYAKYTVPAHFAHWLGTMAAFFTAFYSMRLLHLTFLSTPQGYKKVMEGVHDAPILMALPLFLLSIGSIFVGYVSRDMIIGVGTDFWSNALFTHPNNLTLLEAEFIPHSIKLVPVIFSLTGAITAFYMYTWSIDTLYNLKISNTGRVLYTFLNRKWFFDKTYTEFITQSALHHGYHTTYKMVDRGVIELLGPHGISQVLYQKSKNLSKFQSGHLYHYTLVMLIGISLPLALIAFNKVSVSIGDPRLYVLFLVSGILWQTRK
jgi:NADH-ubiquinone oxidoreductase chain 5